MITTVERMSAREAYEHMVRSDALLVCAYPETGRFEKNRLEGASSLAEFHAQKPGLARDREIIFYCACPHDESAARQAEAAKAQGFHNARILDGGVTAWRRAGYGDDSTPS